MKSNKIIIALTTVTFVLLAEAAVAGPDWAVIERARAAKQMEQAEQAKRAATDNMAKCPQQVVVNQEALAADKSVR